MVVKVVKVVKVVTVPKKVEAVCGRDDIDR